MRVIAKCKMCNKEFVTYDKRLKSGHGKFCCKKCYSTYQSLNYDHNKIFQGTTIVKCKCCGKEFRTTKSRVESGRDKFCSLSCKNNYRKLFLHCRNKQYSILIKKLVYDDLLTQEEICRELNLSKSMLYNIGKEFYIDYSYKNHPEDILTKENLLYYINDLHYDIKQIASKLNLSYQIVRKYLIKYNIKKNPYIKLKCKYCGKEFKEYKCHDYRSFCSKQCYTKYMLKHPETTNGYIDGRSKKTNNNSNSIKRRRYLSYNPLNEKMNGYVGHHVNREDVMFIPEIIHRTYSGHGLISEQMFKVDKLIVINTVIDMLIKQCVINKGKYKSWVGSNYGK